MTSTLMSPDSDPVAPGVATAPAARGGLAGKVLGFFRTRPDVPCRITDAAELHRRFEWRRWSVFVTALAGYAMFYTCRLNFSIAKKEILQDHLLSTTQMGTLGMMMLVVYSVGKLTNGFLADRCNVARFMSTALLVSAVVNVLLGLAGFVDYRVLHRGAESGKWLAANGFFLLFLLGWTVNGWAQSVGSGPCIVALSQWFSKRERGLLYGVWGTSHPLGTCLSLYFTACLVVRFGWQWGFVGPGLACAAAAMVMYFTLADRPQTYGLPPVHEYKHEPPESAARQQASVGQLQWEALKNPGVWILAFASGGLYIGRYGLENWGPLYLEEGKHYSKAMMAMIFSASPFAHIVGCATAGVVSDRFFRSNRNLPAFIYGAAEVASLLALYWSPPGAWLLDAAMLAIFGFAMGGLLVYLSGLMPIELVSRRAAGAAVGIVGVVSYILAGVQDKVSGNLLDMSKTVVDGKAAYSFHLVFAVWIVALAVSLLLSSSLWFVMPRKRGETAEA